VNCQKVELRGQQTYHLNKNNTDDDDDDDDNDDDDSAKSYSSLPVCGLQYFSFILQIYRAETGYFTCRLLAENSYHS